MTLRRIRRFVRRSTSETTLLALAKQVAGPSRTGSKWESGRTRLIQCALPTPLALKVVGTVTTLVLIVALALAWGDPAADVSLTTDTLLVLWQVQAGLAAFALPLLLFVIETARSDSSAGAARIHEVLLRHTALFPIMIGALAGTLVIGVSLIFRPSHSPWPVFALILVATLISAIFAFYRALELTFSRTRLRAATLELLTEQMRISATASTLRRMANNLLPARLEAIGFDYTPILSRKERKEFVEVISRREGLVEDLNLELLEDLAALLSSRRIIPTANWLFDGAQITLGLRSEATPTPQPRWVTICGERLRADRTPILFVPKEGYAHLTLDQIRTAADRVLIIRKIERPTLEIELGPLRDVVVDAIRARRTRLVDDNLEIYESLIKEFLKFLQRWESGYDASKTAVQDSSFRGQWAELKWIERDLAEFGNAALAENDFASTQLVLNTCYGLASYAAGEQEFYVYQHLLNLLVRLYAVALDVSRPDIVDKTAERIASVLGQLGDLKLAVSLREASTSESIKFVREASLALQHGLDQLSKLAMDAKRPKDMSIFIRAAQRAAAGAGRVARASFDD